jgi:hypothetical protein
MNAMITQRQKWEQEIQRIRDRAKALWKEGKWMLAFGAFCLLWLGVGVMIAMQLD